MTWFQEDSPVRDVLGRVAVGVLYVIIIGAIILFLYDNAKNDAMLEKERKAVICPSFLSIARSARDTLIVMRNEPLCNAHVLENLK